MTDKNLTSTESLALIEKMIANTRSNFSRNGGAMFLVWGYLTIAVTALVAWVALRTSSPYTVFLWAIVPLIGGAWAWLRRRKHPAEVKTHLDTTMRAVWLAFYLVAVACMVHAWGNAFKSQPSNFDFLWVIGLMMGAVVYGTGATIKSSLMVYCGMFAAMWAVNMTNLNTQLGQLIQFVVIVITALIIPGHMLRAAARREARGEVGIDTTKWDARVAVANARKVARIESRTAKKAGK